MLKNLASFHGRSTIKVQIFTTITSIVQRHKDNSYSKDIMGKLEGSRGRTLHLSYLESRARARMMRTRARPSDNLICGAP